MRQKRKEKRRWGILLTAAMLMMTACSGQNVPAEKKPEVKEQEKTKESGTVQSGNSGTYDKVVYAYSTFNNIPAQKDLAVVEEAINEITRKKIGVEVTLMPVGFADYTSKISLALQGGEQIDIFQSLGNFNTCVAQDMTYDMTELIGQYASKTKELVGEEWMTACSSQGKLYGIPTMKPVALTPMVIYRDDIVKELGIDMAAVTAMEDMTEIFRQVKEAYPEMTPLAPVQPGEIGVSVNYKEADFLTDSMYSPVGVLFGDEMKVLDLYSTEQFKERCNLVRQWYQEGLVMKDAATTTSMAAELMSSGNYFCYIAAYSYPEKDTAASLEAQCGGQKIGARMIGDAYLSTADLNAVSWMIASTTRVPEAAMKFLDLTYTDPDVINLLIYGVEGRDYVLNGDGFMSYPEGQDSTTVPYTAQLSCGTLGNFFLMYPMVGTDKASLVWEQEQNKNAKTSPAMGFTFDSARLKTQYTAVTNVISQYLPGLTCGSLDPETETPKFLQALKDAGYDQILEEKQKQLDQWAAEQ